MYESPDILIKEFENRAKWYCKGFAGLLAGSVGNKAYFYSSERTFEFQEELKEGLQELVDLYDVIPFEELQSHPDIDVFLYIRGKIPELIQESESILSGVEFNKTRIREIIKNIRMKGSEYGLRLIKLQEKIRAYPGLKRFSFKTNDLDDRLWYNAIH